MDNSYMEKKAILNAIISAVRGGWTGLTQLGTTGAVMVLAAAAATGGAAGYTAAKLTEHNPQDIDTAKKEYENERLKADLGYLRSKVRAEAAAMENKKAPRAARVIA